MAIEYLNISPRDFGPKVRPEIQLTAIPEGKTRADIPNSPKINSEKKKGD